MGTLLIIHGDEGNEADIHTVIILNQTLTDQQVVKKFDEMRDEIEEWIGDYDQPTLTQILSNHGLSGTVLHPTVLKGTINPETLYYHEVFC